MNKKYIQPRTFVTNVTLKQIVALSAPQVNMDIDNQGVTPELFEVKHRDDFDDYSGEGDSWGDLW